MPRIFKSTLAPWALHSQINNNKENFPNLTHNINNPPNNSVINNENYQKNIETNNTFAQLAKDQQDFANIPEIEKTIQLFNMLVSELKDSSDHGARLVIMMKYCKPNNVI